MTHLYCIISTSRGVDVPAGFIVRVGDDYELRVGDDGRPLLLPYFLERDGEKTHELGMRIHMNTL